MKKIISLCLLVAMLPAFGLCFAVEASAEGPSLALDCRAALLMDAKTGTVLYEQNPDEPLPLASVTKIMTLLLVMEAVDGGKIDMADMVTVSEEAASMGGSQVFLEPGEQMSVEDMIKCVVISSANDAAYALAEHIAGSEPAFVEQMNRRAAELGMKNAHFENTNGLDDTTTDHRCSARDIAIMSRELISHEKILEYTNIWMDTIRNGSFTLSNTNRLIRFYPGATGLKTGSTSKALFCISATAERDGMHLIAVIMGSPTRDIRNAEAKKLLDYGFANYGLYTAEACEWGSLPVTGGVADSVRLTVSPFAALLEKGKVKNVTVRYALPEALPAPLAVGDEVGKAEFLVGDEVIGTAPVTVAEPVAKISFGQVLLRLLEGFLAVR